MINGPSDGREPDSSSSASPFSFFFFSSRSADEHVETTFLPAPSLSPSDKLISCHEFVNRTYVPRLLLPRRTAPGWDRRRESERIVRKNVMRATTCRPCLTLRRTRGKLDHCRRLRIFSENLYLSSCS